VRLFTLAATALLSLLVLMVSLYTIDYLVGVLRYVSYQFDTLADQVNQTAARQLPWQPVAPDIETLMVAVVPLVLAGIGLALFATFAHTRRR